MSFSRTCLILILHNSLGRIKWIRETCCWCIKLSISFRMLLCGCPKYPLKWKCHMQQLILKFLFTLVNHFFTWNYSSCSLTNILNFKWSVWPAANCIVHTGNSLPNYAFNNYVSPMCKFTASPSSQLPQINSIWQTPLMSPLKVYPI